MKNLILVIALMAPMKFAQALAAESDSQSEAKISESESQTVENNELAEPFYQPAAHQVVLSLLPQISHLAVKSTFAGNSKSYVGGSNKQLLGLAMDGALTEAIALHLSTHFGNMENFGGSSTTSKSSGFSDIDLALNAHSDLSAKDKIIYGLSFGYSPDKSKDSGISRSGQQVEGNLFSGGNSYTPQIGYQHKTSDNLIIGSSLGYVFRDPRTLVSSWDNTQSTYTGENTTTLAGIIEKQFEQVKLGGILMHMWNEKSYYDGQDNNDSFNSVQAGMYSNFLISNRFSIQPAIYYMTITKRSFGPTTIDQYDQTSLMLQARMSL